MFFKINNRKQKINAKTLIAAGAFLLLLIVFIFFIINSNKEKKEIEAMIEYEKEQLRQEYAEWNFHSETIFEAGNDSLISLLEEERNKIQHLLERIRILEASDISRFNELRKELEATRESARYYIKQVDSLNNLNKELRTENSEIKKRNEEVETDLQKLTNEAELLSSKIALASILEVENIQVDGISSNGKKAMSLSRIEDFQCCFHVLRNRVADVGMKDVYVRFTSPKGILFAFPNNTFKYEDKEISYTAKKTIEYEGLDIDVCLFWKAIQPLQAGFYRTEIFIDSFLVGEREILW
jgi:hypothetical protein